MSFQLNDQVIRLLCGRFSYEDGEAIYQAGKVTFTREDPETSIYEATIEGEKAIIQVSVDYSREELDAICSCPVFHPDDQYCKHIAAVLLNMNDFGIVNGSPTGSHSRPSKFSEDMELTSRMLELFDHKPLRPTSARPFFDSREILDVEFICKPVPYNDKKYLFGIEIKVGAKRLYIVQNVRQFLNQIDKRESCVISKQFTYDPKLHSFQKENDAIIQLLIQIVDNEPLYNEVERHDSDRLLMIHPASWEDLLSLLTNAPSVKLVHSDSTFHGICISDEPIPLVFAFDQSMRQAEGYQLDVQGLDRITVMEPYGVVITEGKLLKPTTDQYKRLLELKQIFDGSRKHQVYIMPEQVEPFMEKVIPGLMKLGRVSIAQAVSDRMVQTPLKANLFLDRVKDRLLAGLEFQYGDIVINPLEASGQKGVEGRLLLRDRDQERQILELIEQNPFIKTDGGYFLSDEDEEYHFLYHVVPQLEKLVQVFATSAVKSKLHIGHVHPKVRVDVDERTDWLELQFEIEGIPELEIRNLITSLEERRRYHRLPSGALLPLESSEFQEMIHFLDDIGIHKSDVKGTKFRLPVVHGLHLIDTLQMGNTVSLGKSFRRLLENMRNPDHLEFPIPDDLARTLRDYQKYGFQWLKTLAHYRFGGILADEMGLGKTIQSIAFLVSVLPEIRGVGVPAMIVSPSSLMYNWNNELKKFAPEIRVVIADGSREERGGALHDVSQVDVIITSYPLLRRDFAHYAALSFHTLILDEAQAFKNHNTQTAQAVKALRARHRFALTGTPVENSLEELRSIFDVVLPGLFPGRRAFGELTREAVAKRIRPFLLRRLKTDVLKELPEKIESLQASRLLPDQKKLYVAYLAKLQQETLKHLNTDGFNKNRIKILAGLTRLRQLCCHPALFVEGYAGSSAKFDQLMEMVEECRSTGKRILVFSQFTEMLGIIGRELGYQGVPYFYLDGQTPAPERVELCNRFNEGERDVFLLSLKAGGTGLNLTGADTVILYDLWWNPAVEQQAADRAHRIGQKNVVQVIRLVTQGTVEDKMYELQQKKKNLIDEVIEPGQDGLSTLSEDEIRELLMI
ncbi:MULTISPECIES: DEAD/DEAH box helicase [unclassified Paenibacillus]|uniref:DEAD/DEAH box helicase n=1 Tax=unclassified Paenibacillus TaxID=185978 RepID=UPI001AE6E824|nr:MULTISPECIES: DEAD/DEAH box helicase [unclassified Paenibacillus]MBP1155080.1 superfamily II DNA or RNA helicase [Paenibacillus sp. PvP091]MBP1169536.1 superfamily II DNA or RNA helicase [Paenibacillus sp. PvR098]MBP2440564.1 superfamily II DNA or RNA helicase [Paenibacillus sp. PvP052]